MKPGGVSLGGMYRVLGHTDNVQHKGDEPVVGSQGEQQTVNHEDMLEVVYDTLAVEKVHGSAQEVPVERLGEAQAAGLAGNVCDCDDLLEGYDLDRRDDDDYEEVAGTQRPEEAGNHDEGPYGARYEVCLFLLVLALGGLLGGLARSAGGRVGRKAATYRRRRLLLDGGTARVAELGHALRGSPGSSIAGAADLVVELDVLSWTRHGGRGSAGLRRVWCGRIGGSRGRTGREGAMA
jgi:hypothetical protein